MARLHTVVESPGFLRDARSIGMNDDERERIVTTYAARPNAGEEIRGSGGLRKARFAPAGRGKRGGYRVLSLYLGIDVPVILMGVLRKTDREDFTDAEIVELAALVAAIKAAVRKRR